jgi:hypothetical protein
VRPSQGAKRGSAGFNLGVDRGQNPFNINEWGSGLWSYGIDVNKPGYQQDVRAFYNAKLASTDSDFKKRVAEELAKKGKNASDDLALTNAVDWYYRDLGRRMERDNGFLSSTIGKILGTGLQVGLGFVPVVGPALSAAAGAGIGGATGGWKGALLGGISGYGTGAGAQSVYKGLASSAPLTSINSYFPADIAARAGVNTAKNYATSALGAAAGAYDTFLRGGGSTSGQFSDAYKPPQSTPNYTPSALLAAAPVLTGGRGSTATPSSVPSPSAPSAGASQGGGALAIPLPVSSSSPAPSSSPMATAAMMEADPFAEMRVRQLYAPRPDYSKMQLDTSVRGKGRAKALRKRTGQRYA